MLTINETLEVLQTYNIHSHKYEPTVYQNKNQIGICLDIKDSLFGYLTRAFTFNTKEELNDFLKGFFWYKNNHQKYDIKLTLDSYDTYNPKLIYKYQNSLITLQEMLNINNFLEKEKEENIEEEKKAIYLINIENINKLFNRFKKIKRKHQRGKKYTKNYRK